jgi:chemotaxis protein MotB
MAAKKQKEEAPASTLGWMVTFSDMVTLLLTFFVLLLTMCSLEAHKIKEMQRVTLDAMGVLYEGEKSEVGFDTILSGREKVLIEGERSGLGLRTVVFPGATIKEAVSVTETISERYARLKIRLVREHLLDVLEFEETEKGLNLLLRNELLFNPGGAEINPKGTPVLNKLGGIVEKEALDVVVEGHTDNVPISTDRFPSNWELSIARAVNVVKYLTEEAGVKPMRLSAVGYGDTKPKVSNDTPENQRKNRRVAIVLTQKSIVGR